MIELTINRREYGKKIRKEKRRRNRRKLMEMEIEKQEKGKEGKRKKQMKRRDKKGMKIQCKNIWILQKTKESEKEKKWKKNKRKKIDKKIKITKKSTQPTPRLKQIQTLSNIQLFNIITQPIRLKKPSKKFGIVPFIVEFI